MNFFFFFSKLESFGSLEECIIEHVINVKDKIENKFFSSENVSSSN